MTFAGFSHVMMYVNDVERAAAWYQSILGFKSRFITPDYGSLFHDGINFRMDLHPDHQRTKVGGGAQIYFVTNDLDAVVLSLRQQGVSVDDPRSESGSPRFAAFRDSEGNELGLTEPAKR